MSMKSICIIGAGPAGLVAAKTFLQKGGFSVTIFEAAERVGGMWRAQPGEHGDKCDPQMRTNLSRFTVAFSDLSWTSVNLSDPAEAAPSPVTPPFFPRAWQVGRYLDTYAHKFGVAPTIVFSRRVISTVASEDFSRWQVTCLDDRTGEFSKHHFDFLVIASGFFSKSFEGNYRAPLKGAPNFQHSSNFRDLLSLEPGKIAVIGGGISGSEAAAQAAFQISNHKHSPGKANPAHAESKVYHILNRPIYCLPRYLPVDPRIADTSGGHWNPAPKFLPNDMVLYNLSRRGQGMISAAIATVPEEKASKSHKFLKSLIGANENNDSKESKEINHELIYNPDQTGYPAYTGITDTYSEFVRSGIIVPVQGWVNDVQQREDTGNFSIHYSPKAPWRLPSTDLAEQSTITDVTGIIEATGYETDLSFLDDRVKRLLSYDPSCPRVPILLTRGSIFAAQIPSLSFVGFYEGPYWSVMELQAGIVADTWTKTDGEKTPSTIEGLHQDTDAQQMRLALKAKSPSVPQFWMMDYVGLVEEFARETGTKRSDAAFGGQTGPIFASRYQGPGTGGEAAAVIEEVAHLVKASDEEARFVPVAVFRALQGVWQLKRKIETHDAISQGGTYSGVAHFHPRMPTDPKCSAEYLYIEQGTFTFDNNWTTTATRYYIYRYDEAKDQISVWTADEDNKSASILLHTWKFHAPAHEVHGWMAKGHHWCDPDWYENNCEFRFRGAALDTIRLSYDVKGPRKDYRIDSRYERPQTEAK